MSPVTLEHGMDQAEEAVERLHAARLEYFTRQVSYPPNPLPMGGRCPCSSCSRRRETAERWIDAP